MATQKKNSTGMTKNSSPSTPHPPYFKMISEAITTMKDRTGSSQPAIAKYIEQNYTKQLPSNFKKILSVQLKRFVKSEKLTKIKNSYKIFSNEKIKKPQNSMKEKISQSLTKKASYKATVKKPNLKVAVAMKTVEKAKKTKTLSQIKTLAKQASTPAKRKAVSRVPQAKKAKK